MPQLVHQFTFYLHIFAGSIALVAFWLPFFTRKGDKNHRRFGQIFANTMYFVTASGVIMSTLVLVDPIGVRYPDQVLSAERAANLAYQNRVFAGFLFMLSILVICNVRQALLVLKARANRDLLKTPSHIGIISFLGLTGFIVGWIGLTKQVLLLEIFAAFCILTSAQALHYIFKPSIKAREWIIVHLGNISGAGIATYTAFFAFGGSRLFSDFLTGNLQVIPWVLPGIIGGFGIAYMNRKYEQQFRVTSLAEPGKAGSVTSAS
jgi:uncharacterized membrane protein